MTAATNPRPGRSTLVAALGTILFVLFVGPGPVIGLVPLLLSGWRLRPPLLGWEPFRFIGVALLLLGLPVLVDALVRFVRRGRGTPAPVAPPERLVAVGAYRYVRNPMYVAVVAMILGQALLLGSAPVLVYAAGAFLAFHLFVVLYEEPDLRRRFGDDYLAYTRRVRRWVPLTRRGRRGVARP
jgi:protein-S-isoprenylcysteine O-methyltransferase Ste14